MYVNRLPPVFLLVGPTTNEFLAEHHIESISRLLDRFPPDAPSTFSIKENMSPVKPNGQGMGEVCCSFATAAALEYVHGRIALSEANLADVGAHMYSNCQPTGLTIGQAMQICRDQGIVLEGDWPYDQTQLCWAHPPNISAKQHYKFSNIATVFQRPNDEILDNMKIALKNGSLNDKLVRIPANFVTLIKAALLNLKLPVVIGVPVWFKYQPNPVFDAGWDLGPDVHMPTPVNLEAWLRENERVPGGVAGWHAIPISGYDDTKSRFEFKNSWGIAWGTWGYGTIPYDYITQYAQCGMLGTG